MREFFVVAPPGLEEELLAEIREIEPFLIGPDGRPSLEGLGEIRVEKGGVTLQTEPLLALQLHFWLKTAARILMRLERFHATEFYQLEKHLKRCGLDPWIGQARARLQVDATKSKLGQEKRILEVATKIWGQRLTSGDDENAQQLFLRAESDEFTLSLDLTGEHLHKRGVSRELAGPAPIRETLAAALIRFLIDATPLTSLQNVILRDPMAGSGTLLSEASRLYRPLQERAFAFQSQPWIPKILKSPSFLANDRSTPEKIWKSLQAFDQHPLAQERLRELGRNLSDPFEVLTDSTGSPMPDSTTALWIIANPPYGERLEALPVADLVRILSEPKPTRVAVILPKKKAEELQSQWPSGWQVRKKPVQNGGLPCLFLVFSVSH